MHRTIPRLLFGLFVFLLFFSGIVPDKSRSLILFSSRDVFSVPDSGKGFAAESSISGNCTDFMGCSGLGEGSASSGWADRIGILPDMASGAAGVSMKKKMDGSC